MALQIPSKYKVEILKLANAGFEVYLVGGCVRDHLLGKPIKDYDIITTATPEEGLVIFPGAITLAKQFGVLRVPVGSGEFLDIATARKDGPYTDQRRPDFVEYASVVDDLKRRDFTVNALLYDLKKEEVVDLVEGLKDLSNKVLRAVGDPRERFKEDPLRMWRAVRFQVKLGFSLEEETRKALVELSALASSPSRERIYVELKEAVKVDSQKTFMELESTGLMSYFIPTKPFPKESLTWEETLLYLSSGLTMESFEQKLPLTGEEKKFVKTHREYLISLEKFSSLTLEGKNRLKYHPLSSTAVEYLSKVGRPYPSFDYKSQLTKSMYESLVPSAQVLIAKGFSGKAISTAQKLVESKVLSESLLTEESVNEFLGAQLKST